MRKQNPPSAYIKKAEQLEEYLRPGTLDCLYALIALVWVAIVSLVFAALVLTDLLEPTFWAITIMALVADVPVIEGAVAYLHYSYNPLSGYFSGRANEWRRPLEVPGNECIFKTSLRAGDEMLIVKLAFHYPVEHQSLEVRGRLYTFAHGALATQFSMTYALPSFSDVERALDPSMEMLAAEYNIPVLYAEILDVRKVRMVYDVSQRRVTSQNARDDKYLARAIAS